MHANILYFYTPSLKGQNIFFESGQIAYQKKEVKRNMLEKCLTLFLGWLKSLSIEIMQKSIFSIDLCISTHNWWDLVS